MKIVIEELTSRMENCDIHFSGMLSCVNWWLVTDVSAQLRALYSRVKQSLIVSERRSLITNRPYVTSQKSEDLICTAVEAWNHAEKRKLHNADRHSMIRVKIKFRDVGEKCIIGRSNK